jgi:hypothetical protein
MQFMQMLKNSSYKGLFDPIVPRNLLKGILSKLFQLHAFFPHIGAHKIGMGTWCEGLAWTKERQN